MKNKLLSFIKHPLGLLLAILALGLGTIYLAWTVLGFSPVHRAATLLLAALVGGLLLGSLALLLWLKERKVQHSSPADRALEQALSQLAECLPREGRLTRLGAVTDVPWVVVLGTRGAGKSTALGTLVRAAP